MFVITSTGVWGFPAGACGKDYACRCRGHRDIGSIPGSGRSSGLGGPAVHGVAKSWTRLSVFTVTFHFPALEKALATHSSVLVWRIPGTGESGGLPSVGSHRVGHDWSDLVSSSRSRKGQPLQCSCLRNSMDRGAWWATVCGAWKRHNIHTHSHTNTFKYGHLLKEPWLHIMASFPLLSNLGSHFFGLDGKESSCNEGDQGSIPGLGRSPGGGHGNQLQYSGLENPRDRGAWWAAVHGAAKSRTRLSG